MLNTDRTTTIRLTGNVRILILLGILSLAGCLGLILGTFIAPYYVPDYNWWADTISDLAAGDSEIIMDVALYGFATGIMACALAACMITWANPAGPSAC